jgi:hypothetical protein
MLILAGLLRAEAEDVASVPPPPPFKQLRYDENYASLRDPQRRADYLDDIKFISFNTNGDWYLTLGGDIRERYEYYHNSLWGRGPQDDNGYLLQRYMIHADAHLGDYPTKHANHIAMSKMSVSNPAEKFGMLGQFSGFGQSH